MSLAFVVVVVSEGKITSPIARCKLVSKGAPQKRKCEGRLSSHQCKNERVSVLNLFPYCNKCDTGCAASNENNTDPSSPKEPITTNQIQTTSAFAIFRDV
jgi:hypothetical protein